MTQLQLLSIIQSFTYLTDAISRAAKNSICKNLLMWNVFDILNKLSWIFLGETDEVEDLAELFIEW